MLLLRSPSPEPLSSTSRPTCPSLSPSDSPRLFVPPPPVVPSLSASSTIGRCSPPIPSRSEAKLRSSSSRSEPERVSALVSLLSITSSTSSERFLKATQIVSSSLTTHKKLVFSFEPLFSLLLFLFAQTVFLLFPTSRSYNFPPCPITNYVS